MGYIAIYWFHDAHPALAPFDVWIEDPQITINQSDASRYEYEAGVVSGASAKRCGPTITQDPVKGVPIIISCWMVGQFVTIRQTTTGMRLSIAEVQAFTPWGSGQLPATWPRSRIPIQMINTRFHLPKPGNNLVEAGPRGILVHMLDEYEDIKGGREWAMCLDGCLRNVDFFAATLIYSRKPCVYWDKSHPDASSGIIMSPHTPILCGFHNDVGSAHKLHGGCAGDWNASTLDATLALQHGKINEMIIDGMWWDRHLPEAVEAFFYLAPPKSKLGFGKLHCEWRAATPAMIADIRASHRRFLQRFGLTKQEVPLLRYDADTFSADEYDRQ